mgnify:CR=1 FL=1
MEQREKETSLTLIKVVDGGPLEIKGKFVLRDLKRDIEEIPAEVSICLCGKSSDKPFCDGSHEKS